MGLFIEQKLYIPLGTRCYMIQGKMVSWFHLSHPRIINMLHNIGSIMRFTFNSSSSRHAWYMWHQGCMYLCCKQFITYYDINIYIYIPMLLLFYKIRLLGYLAHNWYLTTDPHVYIVSYLVIYYSCSISNLLVKFNPPIFSYFRYKIRGKYSTITDSYFVEQIAAQWSTRKVGLSRFCALNCRIQWWLICMLDLLSCAYFFFPILFF